MDVRNKRRPNGQGSCATDGVTPIVDIEPQSLHQRTPLVIGSREDVEFVRTILTEDGA